MPVAVAKKKQYPWETKSWFVNMRRTTGYLIKGMDESHVYAEVHLAIPKADLALDDDEAKRDAEEFGDRGIAYTLENKVCGYLHREHQAWKNSTPQFARSDLRAYWRMGKKIFGDRDPSPAPPPEPTEITWQEALSLDAGILVVVGRDSEARASAARRIAKHKRRSLLELDIERETIDGALSGPLDYVLSPEHDARCVVHLNGLDRSFTERDAWDNAPVGQGALEQVVSVIDAKRYRTIVILGYHEGADVPRAIWTHENVKVLYPDSLGCTEFGAGFRDPDGKPA
ncbi:hypothetical protein [Rhizobium sp. BK176]|uniref:hypothetical protein n=1 Tax=Rhizobium sp. BK176 TaxID=2587071 RepID=UPI0021672D53|nr:hypothetical protein [Rhizobium sp. BK176]MCS4088562.1 hypothetical protein [Rhizobium sp. BK176]